MSYYYLAAQLPFLQFAQKEFPRTKLFIEECRRWCTPRDFSLVAQVALKGSPVKGFSAGVYNKYQHFEQLLQQELVSMRRAKKSQTEYKCGYPLKEFNFNDTPLNIELNLLLLCWKYIESLEVGHYFDRDFIVLYYLKLQILERIASFDAKQGTRNFHTFTEVVYAEEEYS